jgi:thiamine-phosphate pyrophosphorylase
MKRETLALYLVTDRGLALGRDLETVVLQAVKGGVTLVQLREKDLDTREFIALGQRLKAALAGSGVPLLINDRVDVALAVDADGVHIGQSDMPYEIARRLLEPDKIIGLSVETMDEVVEANALDVDYVAVSPVFSTNTKTDTLAPFGYEGLRRARALSRHPLCGIGGMNAATAGQAVACGADGVAVVSAIVSAPDPYLASKNLKSIIDNELDKRRLG